MSSGGAAATTTNSGGHKPVAQNDVRLEQNKEEERGPFGECARIFAPGFTWKSSSFAALIIYTVIFLILFIGAASNDYDANQSDKLECQMMNMGALYPPAIHYDYHLYLLVTPIYMVAGAIDWMINSFVICFTFFFLERMYQRWKFIFIFVISFLIGNIFTAVTEIDGVWSGATYGSSGLLGLNLIFLFTHLKNVDSKEFNRGSLFILYGLAMLAFFIFIPLAPNVSVPGHVMAFITGACWGGCFSIPHKRGDTVRKNVRTAKIFIYAGTVFLIFVCFILVLALNGDFDEKCKSGTFNHCEIKCDGY